MKGTEVDAKNHKMENQAYRAKWDDRRGGALIGAKVRFPSRKK